MKRPYRIRGGGSLGESICHLHAMRSNVQFNITIKSADVQNTPLGQEVFRLVEKINASERLDIDTCFAPYDLILMHFLPLLIKLAPTTSVDGLTVYDLVRAPTYYLEVFSTESGELEIRGEETCTLTPAYDIAPLSISDAPKFWETIPRTHARNLTIARSLEEMSPLKMVQGKVKTTKGHLKYFKPRELGRENEFHREVELLHRIKDAGLADPDHRLPVLESLVVSDEQEEVVVGLLMNLIASPALGCHLQSPGFRDRRDLHEKWEEQVITTVKLLHEHEIVWGDVNACNVAIDQDLNAWVIDFGGRNTREFVDDDKAETVEGDWQGVHRLFKNWLPSQAVSNHC